MAFDKIMVFLRILLAIFRQELRIKVVAQRYKKIMFLPIIRASSLAARQLK